MKKKNTTKPPARGAVASTALLDDSTSVSFDNVLKLLIRECGDRRNFRASHFPVLKREKLRLKRSNATMKLHVLLLQRPDVAPLICEFLAELIVWCMWHRTVASNDKGQARLPDQPKE
jgi:hypothetical protein